MSDVFLVDWVVNIDVILAQLFDAGIKVRLYNGVCDLSVCNHMGNLDVALGIRWVGADAFARAKTAPWGGSDSAVEGYLRGDGLLRYATVLRTGHLVPTVVPKVYATLLKLLPTE